MRVCSVCQRCYDDLEFSCAIETHPTPAEFRPGRPEMITGFRLERVIAAEGRREAYYAKHLDSGHECLVHIYKGSAQITDQFTREAGAAKALFHPNVADVYEAGLLSDGEYFVVSEAIEGQTLSELLQTRGVPDLLDAITLVRQAAEALHAIHLKGMLHRAIRSDNIVVTKDLDGRDLIKLTGIDLGGVAQHSMVADKFSIDCEIDRLRYFAPEIFGGEEASIKSDVYSLGIVFYEMLAGRTPFNAASASGLVEMHRNSRPAEIRIDDFELRMLITHALAESLMKRPEKRQTSANAFARQLRHIEQLSTHVSTPPPAIKVTELPHAAPARVEQNIAASKPLPASHFPAPEVAIPMPQAEPISQPLAVRAPENAQAKPVRRKKRHTPPFTALETVIDVRPAISEQNTEKTLAAAAATSTTYVERKKVELPQLDEDIPTLASVLEELSKEPVNTAVVQMREELEQVSAPIETLAQPIVEKTEISKPLRDVEPGVIQKPPVVEPQPAPKLKVRKRLKQPASPSSDLEEITARPVRIRVPVDVPRKERRPAFARAAFSNSANDAVFFPTMLGSNRGGSEDVSSDDGGVMSTFYSDGTGSKLIQYRSYIAGVSAIALTLLMFWAAGSFEQRSSASHENESSKVQSVATSNPKPQQAITTSPEVVKTAVMKTAEKTQPVSSSSPSTSPKPKEEKAEKKSADKPRPTADKKGEKPLTEKSRPTEIKRAVVKKLSTTPANKPTGSTRPRIVMNSRQ